MIKKLNYKYGTQQDKKDLEILLKHIIKEHLELYLYIL